MYRIKSIKGKGFFGGKNPVENANEWLASLGNNIKVISVSPVFDEDAKIEEILITYEENEIVHEKLKNDEFEDILQLKSKQKF